MLPPAGQPQQWKHRTPLPERRSICGKAAATLPQVRSSAGFFLWPDLYICGDVQLPFNIELGRPEALYLLALLPLLLGIYLWHRMRVQRALRHLSQPGTRARLLPGWAPARKHTRFALALTAFALGVLALAHPRRPAAGDAELRSGIDQLFVLDISNSMLAADIAPNRLTRAKALLEALMARRPDDRVGLVVFAGSAYVQLPLTYDHGSARMFIETANPGQVAGQGTAIGAALERCIELFDQPNGRYRTVLLLTDGETHDEAALEQARELANRGVMINTLGLGSPQGTTLTDPEKGMPKRDENGNVVVSRLNEELLQQIAATGKGQYVHLTDVGAANELLLRQLAQVRSTGLVDKTQLSYEPFYPWLLLPMMLLLLLEAFIRERKKPAL